MSKKTGKPVTFRPSAKNEKRFEYASSLGINRAKVINDILDLHFQNYLIERRQFFADDLKILLENPVP